MPPRNRATYTIAEIAEMTGLSRQTVTRLFEKEPGVIILRRPERKHKRGYRSIRVPRAVCERVMRLLSVL